MNNRRSVAVITRTKNRPILLARAIQSVLNQTFADWQHVIVNDGGPAEDVENILRELKPGYGDRLSIIHNPESRGMEAASNQGIQASESRYIVIHDDDDTWEPTFLEDCISEYERCEFPTVRGVLCLTNQIFERIESQKIIEERRQDYNPNLFAITLPEISEINQFLPISFLFERSVFDEIGLYDESLPVIGDWEFNVRFFLKFDVVVLRKNLANYHVRLDSGPEYDNSVTAAKTKHQFHRALIVNKIVRNSIEKGNFSEGELLILGDYFYRAGSGSQRIANILDRMKDRPVISRLRKLFNF